MRIDRARKLPITVILRALGYGTDQQLIDLLGEDERLMATINRSDANIRSQTDALLEIYRRQKPGEPPTEEGARILLHNLFFDPKRYDLMRVGRYKAIEAVVAAASRAVSVDQTPARAGHVKKGRSSPGAGGSSAGINAVNKLEDRVHKVMQQLPTPRVPALRSREAGI